MRMNSRRIVRLQGSLIKEISEDQRDESIIAPAFHSDLAISFHALVHSRFSRLDPNPHHMISCTSKLSSHRCTINHKSPSERSRSRRKCSRTTQGDEKIFVSSGPWICKRGLDRPIRFSPRDENSPLFLPFAGKKTESLGRPDAYGTPGYPGDAVGGINEQSAVAGSAGTQADATHPQDPGKLVDGGGRPEE